MADTKISALPPAASLGATDIWPIVQAGVTDKITAQLAVNFMATSLAGHGLVASGNVLNFAQAGNYTVGDLPYANAGTTITMLAGVATGNALISGGVATAPSYGKIGLTTHVIGTLPVANGGTGTATAFTQGSVVFAGAAGVFSQDNTNFFWNAASTFLKINGSLGIGVNPTTFLELGFNGGGGITLTSYRANALGGNITINHARGTLSVPANVNLNDVGGHIYFQVRESLVNDFSIVGDIYSIYLGNNGTNKNFGGLAFAINSTPDVAMMLSRQSGFGTVASFFLTQSQTLALTPTNPTLYCDGDFNLRLSRAFIVSSGTDQRAGTLTLVGGTKTVNNTTVTTNTVVILTRKTSGGTIGTAITYTVSAGVSFTVSSDNVLDTSTFSYFLIEVP